MKYCKYAATGILGTMIVVLVGHCALAAGRSPARPRVIVTTDGEIDDRCSMIRFLLYTDQWDIKGIILSSSIYHWKGDATHRPHRWEGETWLPRYLSNYAAVYPNLRKNNPEYPTPEYLKKQIDVGNIKYAGDMEDETPGSKRIVRVLLEPDPSPVWLQAWGGANTIARALKTIEQRYPDRVSEVSKKVRLFLITQQDETWKNYIRVHWPKAQVIICEAFGAIAYRWREIMLPDQQKYFDGRWMRQHILKNHGPLCSAYEALPNGDFRSEGDSPSFMHVINVGLGSGLNPTYGGWGGRYVWAKDHWDSAEDDGDRYETILRWAAAFQNDWAARADWCVKPPAKCNHPPIVVCNGDRTKRVLEQTVAPGTTVTLDADGSTDPDHNRLTYRWWVYTDAGSYWRSVPLTGANTKHVKVTVPAEASGRTIHVILEVADDGAPPLTRYRRVILRVGGKPLPIPNTPRNARYLQTPITSLNGPDKPDSSSWSFYRGFNINGSPISIDGHQWQGDNAKDLACKDRQCVADNVVLRPPTDSARAQMIHSFRWNSRGHIRVSHVPNGTYAVYLYLWEDNDPEQFTIRVNGQIVQRRYRSGVRGEWHRAGPWITHITNGTIDIRTSGGAANVSGVEIWRRTDR